MGQRTIENLRLIKIWRKHLLQEESKIIINRIYFFSKNFLVKSVL